MLSALAAAHAHGVAVDWAPLFKDTGATHHRLPTYPFQRQRYWLEAGQRHRRPRRRRPGSTEHPLLGAALVASPAPTATSSPARISRQTHPWLADHAVAGTALLPGTAFVELALRAGARGRRHPI